MADATVSVGFSGDSKSAEAAIARLQQQMAAMQEKMKRGGAAVAKSVPDASLWHASAKGISDYATQLISATASAVGLSAVIQQIGAANKQWIDDINKIDASMEEATIKMQIQTGKTTAETQAAIDVVGRAAQETPTTGTLAQSVQLQSFLASTSLEKKSVESGEAFKAVSQTLAALNAFGQGGEFATPTAAGKVLTGAVQGFGLSPDASGLKEVGAALATAFKETTLTGDMVPAWAKEGSTFRQFGSSVPESLGMFSTLVSSGIPAETAAVGMRNFFTKLSDVKPNQERDQALQTLGLTQEDIAPRIGGPSMMQSLNKIANSMQGKTELEKNAFFSQVFGAENVTAISSMLQQRGAAIPLQDKLADQSSFDKAVSAFQASDFARRSRMGISSEMSALEANRKAGGVSWEEADIALRSHFNQRRAQSSGVLESLGIGLIQGRGSINTWMAQTILGQQPKDFVEQAIGKLEYVDVLKGVLDASRRTANATEKSAEKRVHRNGNVENN